MSIQRLPASNQETVIQRGLWSWLASLLGMGSAPPQQAQGPPVGDQTEQAPAKTYKQLLAEEQQRSKKRRTEEQAAELEHRRNLLPDTRARLVVLQTQVTEEVARLPREFTNQWQADQWGDPELLENLQEFYRGIAGRQVARADEVGDVERGLEKCEAAVAGFVRAVTEARSRLAVAAAYWGAYEADLSVPGRQTFLPVSRLVWGGTASGGEIIAAADMFLNGAKQETASNSNALQLLQQQNQATANLMVKKYFDLGRLEIGSHRGFYSTPYDSPYGRFGGEWALRVKDSSLSFLEKDWVFHAHCEARFEDQTNRLGINGLRINPNAAHIKQISQRMAVGMSIEVTAQGQFDQAAQNGETVTRLLKWADSGVGAEAIRKAKR
jgi:hypothetical protein